MATGQGSPAGELRHQNPRRTPRPNLSADSPRIFLPLTGDPVIATPTDHQTEPCQQTLPEYSSPSGGGAERSEAEGVLLACGSHLARYSPIRRIAPRHPFLTGRREQRTCGSAPFSPLQGEFRGSRQAPEGRGVIRSRFHTHPPPLRSRSLAQGLPPGGVRTRDIQSAPSQLTNTPGRDRKRSLDERGQGTTNPPRIMQPTVGRMPRQITWMGRTFRSIHSQA